MIENKDIMDKFDVIVDSIKELKTETGEKAIEAEKRAKENLDELKEYFTKLEIEYYQKYYDPDGLRIFPGTGNKKRH